MEFTRTFTISSYNLGKDVTILLTFDALKDDGTLYVDKFPVAWRVSVFGGEGPYSMMSTYKSQLAVAKPQVVNDKIVAATTWVNINTGYKTDLTRPRPQLYQFTPPVAGTKGQLQAYNKTGVIQDMSVGFENANNMLPPVDVLYFKGVGDESRISAEFTPIIRAYITSDFEETQIMRGAVETPYIWQQNLSNLPDFSNWVLTRNSVSGKYEIKEAMMI